MSKQTLCENDILYENGDFWVSAAEFGSGRLNPKSNGFIVWQVGVTHSVAKAMIGYSGQDGLERAKIEANKRAKEKDQLT